MGMIRFLAAFIISLVAGVVLMETVGNSFIISLIFAAVVAFFACKD